MDAPAPLSPSPHELAPPTLAELLDSRSQRLISDAGQVLGVAARVLDAERGRPLFGDPLPFALPAVPAGDGARPQNAVIDRGPAERYRVLPLTVDERLLGRLLLGPYAADRENALGGVLLHLQRLAAELMIAGQDRVESHRAQQALVEDADAELHHQNERLEAAVARLRELDKIKSSFLATVSHELRTPLTSVIGYSEMLLEGIAGALTPEQREYVTTVMEKGEQLLAIIQGILDISRIESGGVKLDRSRFRIHDALSGALSTVAPAARRKRLAMVSELPAELPLVDGDRDKVRQVLVNLLGNAVKFTPEGGRVVVRAEVAPLCRTNGGAGSGDAPGLRISVADSGIGIPPEAMPRIFEPFFQVDGSATREYGGTGLGLSIVKSFVSAHGGMVWVESRHGEGSTFYLTLPLAG